MKSEIYEILNVDKNSTQKEIREKYYKLSKVFHPDKQPAHLKDLSKIYFNKIETAYKVLINPLSRFLYDSFNDYGI